MPIEVGGTSGVSSLSNLAARSTLAAALTTDQIFNAPVLRVYSEGPDPNPGQILDDFTAPSNLTATLITGIAFGTPTFEGDHAQIKAVDADYNFTYDGSGDAPTIVGWLLTDGETSTANVLYAEKLDEPVTLSATTQDLTIIPIVKLTPTP